MPKLLPRSLCIATALVLAAGSAGAQTQWIEDMLSEECSAESRAAVAQATRDSIEKSVARAEASIQAPAPIEDLSCLGDLLGANVDVFSDSWGGGSGFDVTGMLNDISGGLKSGLDVQTLEGGVERALCAFAQESFADLTKPLSGSMEEIVAGTAADMPSFTDGFGLLNVGSPQTGTTFAPQTGAGATGSGSGQTEVQLQNIWNSIKGGSN